jgi:opacity protein-like surface antigen
MKSRIAVVVLASLAALPAQAADGFFFNNSGVSVGSGMYWGFDLGQSSFALDQGDLDAALTGGLVDEGLDVLAARSDASEDNFSWGLILGYQILPYLAVEAAYVDLGEAEYKYNASVSDGVTTSDVAARLVGDSAGPMVSALGRLPLAAGWDVYGRLGMYFGSEDGSVDVSVDGLSDGFSDSSSSQSFVWGGGLGYTSGRWTARLDYQQFTDVGDDNGVGEVDVDRITFGAVYRTDFGAWR